MAGRGGRGSALLKALEEPARKPGASGEPQGRPQSAAASAPAASKPPIGGGRGSYLLRLIPNTAESTPLVSPTSTHPPKSVIPPPQQPSSQAADPQPPAADVLPKSKPGGRGAALLQMCGPSPPRPVSQVKPIMPSAQAAASAAPTTAMRELSMAEAAPSPSPAPTPTTQPVREPKPKGTGGNPLPISANYIRLLSKSKCWYQYSVSYSPNIDSRGMRYKLLYMHSDVIGPARAFDGNVLFLPRELPSKVTTLFSQNPATNQQVAVKICLVKEISVASRECIQMYNVLFKRIMNILNFVQIGRTASYDPKAAIPLPQQKLQVWPGYVSSVAEYEGGLLLMCDVSHKVLRDETALDIMGNIMNDARKPDKQREMLKELVGQSVITRYNNKTYRIDDIDFSSNPSKQFERREGPISFIQYYKEQYNININVHDQPMLISRPKQKDRRSGEVREQLLCLIPEISHMTGLTDNMRSNFHVMKSIGNHTKVTPQNRQIAMTKFVQSIRQNKEASAQLEMWGLELDSSTVKLQARRFNPEKIFLGNNFVGNAGHKADWTRDVTEKEVILPVELRSWVLIYQARDKPKVQNYLSTYMKVSPQLGIRVNQPRHVSLTDDKIDSYIRAIKDAINETLQLVVVVFPSKREDKYNAVKKLLCSERPCPSQMIITKTISDDRKLRSVVQKIALQINAKLGGEIWQLSIPLVNTMYVGIDVYHDGSKGKGRSVAGLVASLNKSATRYYSRVCTQLPGEELISGLKTCFIAALKKYHDVNNKLPDRVVIYRDGVGDSMIKVVTEHEVKQLQSCFDSFDYYQQSPPGMIFLIVQKRINTRMFAIKGPGMENPPPGTVLDHTVTKAQWYDFYLVPQHITQGTATPTHYVVAYDNTDLNSDKIQQLSYKMCHLYYNWTGTVRVPAPCQYAHKLAYLIGENVKRDPAEELADKLYYL